jgi:hypothetical protein
MIAYQKWVASLLFSKLVSNQKPVKNVSTTIIGGLIMIC